MKLSANWPIESIKVTTITLDQLKAYALAAGDPNPIHQDEEVAKKVGLPGVIAHGMLVASLVAERGLQFVRQAQPDENWIIKTSQSRFKGMTRLGDQVFVGGTVKGISDSELVLDLQAKNERGEVTTTASLVFRK